MTIARIAPTDPEWYRFHAAHPELGRSYYPLQGRRWHVPHAAHAAGERPAAEFLGWHNETVFRG